MNHALSAIACTSRAHSSTLDCPGRAFSAYTDDLDLRLPSNSSDARVIGPDPQDRRRIQLTITARAKPMVGDVDLYTAKRLHAMLNGMPPQVHRHLIDMLRETVTKCVNKFQPGNQG